MKILGITTEGDSGAAVVQDGRILAAVNEERLSRLKLVVGFPRLSIREVLDLSGTEVGELDAVLVAGTDSVFVDTLQPFVGWLEDSGNGSGRFLKKAAGRLAKFRQRLPVLESGYYALLEPSFRQRRRAIRRILQEEFGIACTIQFVDHHFAHVTSAYFTSGFRDALVFSVDGGGDGRSAVVYAYRGGRPELLHEVSAYHSLGNYYAYVTKICGFKAMKHEGKITGLAAYGEPKYVDLLKSFIDFEGGTFVNRGRVAFHSAVHELERRLPRGWRREDLAASVQHHFENVVRSFVGHWARRSGLRDVALAGGVFSNVRVNEEVHRLPEVERMFVHPHMSDGGLAVGAALAASVPGTLAAPMPTVQEPLSAVYLGRDLDRAEVAECLRRHDLRPEPLEAGLEDTIADLLVGGCVVARAAGRMEYGPRALGNRSILYQPTDRSVNDWLNNNLRRTEFMPFAPSMLYDAREQCFEAVAGAEHTAEFMTTTFHCTPWMRQRMHGVVHLDGTARPHLVRQDRNPSFYRLIQAFYERTGLPAIINTSFNIHEEPIVCSAEDCVRAFLAGNLDYLAIGDHLIRHPQGISHPVVPVPGVTSRPAQVGR
ncbi:MAG: carbamoyltransferase C-terminal domain-containing protein [Anaerolineales bacterium]